jgi:hypothetical protein
MLWSGGCRKQAASKQQQQQLDYRQLQQQRSFTVSIFACGKIPTPPWNLTHNTKTWVQRQQSPQWGFQRHRLAKLWLLLATTSKRQSTGMFPCALQMSRVYYGPVFNEHFVDGKSNNSGWWSIQQALHLLRTMRMKTPTLLPQLQASSIFCNYISLIMSKMVRSKMIVVR